MSDSRKECLEDKHTREKYLDKWRKFSIPMSKRNKSRRKRRRVNRDDRDDDRDEYSIYYDSVIYELNLYYGDHSKFTQYTGKTLLEAIRLSKQKKNDDNKLLERLKDPIEFLTNEGYLKINRSPEETANRTPLCKHSIERICNEYLEYLNKKENC